MFEPTSRYYRLETAEHAEPDGRVITYARRRFLPQPSAARALVEVSVADGERLDLITARTLGDPEQYWRICDANGAMHPAELMEEPGRALIVPVPEIARE